MNLIFEVIIGFGIVIAILFLWITYVKWSDGQYQKIYYSRDTPPIYLPPKSVTDSYKYLNFWIQYYLGKQGIFL